MILFRLSLLFMVPSLFGVKGLFFSLVIIFESFNVKTKQEIKYWKSRWIANFNYGFNYLATFLYEISQYCVFWILLMFCPARSPGVLCYLHAWTSWISLCSKTPVFSSKMATDSVYPFIFSSTDGTQAHKMWIGALTWWIIETTLIFFFKFF